MWWYVFADKNQNLSIGGVHGSKGDSWQRFVVQIRAQGMCSYRYVLVVGVEWVLVVRRCDVFRS